MKVTVTIILMTFFCLTLSANNKFQISGTISPQYKGVEIKLLSEKSAFNSIVTKEKNGKFFIAGEIKQNYEPAFLSVWKENKCLGGSFLFIGVQNMKIDILKLNGVDSLSDFHFFNVPFIEEYSKYESMTKPFIDSASKAFKPYSDAARAHLKDETLDSLWTIVSNFRKKLLVQKIKFIESFPNAYISLYLFDKDILHGYHPITAGKLDTVYNKLSSDLKETDFGKSVGKYIKKKLSLTVGHDLPNFSFLTDKGQNYELSSFYNNKKFVLLCFWARYCTPCIKKIPILKILNNKYEARGLQMISISLDEQNAAYWFDSLKKYEMPWLQTCDISPYNQGNDIKNILDVDHMPQYFLIDNTGKLVYHNEQSNDDDEFTVLQKQLDSQLQ